ncbi:MAG: hypothetical protein M3299_01710, partial [Thermoproteota archaeon]|nr:hypothetical protein [Thermoproteota archaeon]
DALAGNDTINQAREFFQYTNFDGAILTKVDADAKGGSAISIAHITSRPIVYIGMGQGYDDIIPFDSNKFIDSLFESGGQVGVSVEEVTSMQKISEIAVEKAKSANPQTIREEEKDIVLLSKPPVKTSSTPMGAPALQEQQQAVKELAPKPIVHQPEPYRVKEQPKEKKSRFGFFGKKRTHEDRSKEKEEEIDKKERYKLDEKQTVKEQEEEEEKESERTTTLKQEEDQRSDKERNLREDKDTKGQEEEEKVVYLTDEDIEDLLK